jgi:hypothetical protein
MLLTKLKIGRIILNSLALLSLLVCVGTMVLWVRSHRIADLLGRESATDATGRRCGGSISSGAGGAQVVFWVRHHAATPLEPGTGWSRFSHAVDSKHGAAHQVYLSSIGATQFLGVAWAHYQIDPSGGRGGVAMGAPTQSVWQLEVPYYLIAVVAALLPACWVWRRSRRPRAGCCARCGYDLRATPDRCPECGAASKAADVHYRV